MGRLRFWCCLAVAAALGPTGCGDPEIDLLDAGSKAVLTTRDRRTIPLLVNPDSPETFREVALPERTRVTVLDDAPAKAPVQPRLRLVRVRVEEGEHQGLVGSVSRYDLRASR